jgi:hypothetical protein
MGRGPAVATELRIAAVVTAVVVVLVGLLSWRVAVALPAPWATPSAVTRTSGAAVPAGSISGDGWMAVPPAGWSIPRDTYGSAIALTDAKRNRISGDAFGRSAQQACTYLVDQALSWQKYARTDLPSATVDGRTALAIKLAAENEIIQFRCFMGPNPNEAWYLQVTYQSADAAAVEKAFEAFVGSFRFR